MSGIVDNFLDKTKSIVFKHKNYFYICVSDDMNIILVITYLIRISNSKSIGNGQSPVVSAIGVGLETRFFRLFFYVLLSLTKDALWAGPGRIPVRGYPAVVFPFEK